VKGVIVSILEY